MRGKEEKPMSRAEAAKILGVKTSASKEEVKTAYKKLAKKYHPDVSGDPNAKEKFIELNKAQSTLRKPQKILDYKKEYSKIRKEMGPNPSGRSLDEAYDKLVEQAIAIPNEIERAETLEKIKLAYEKADEDLSDAEDLAYQKNRLMTKIVLENNLSEEEKLARMKEDLEYEKGKAQLKNNFHKLHQQIINKVKIIKKKAHIPIIKSEKGKKVIKYALLTAGLLSAIIAGRYYYNKRTKAYEPKLLTYRGK